ncbi:PE domain-containing protein [Mycobacterium uberis]|nr:PE domain-containing protein [Mycobacterium uberis]
MTIQPEMPNMASSNLYSTSQAMNPLKAAAAGLTTEVISAAYDELRH